MHRFYAPAASTPIIPTPTPSIPNQQVPKVSSLQLIQLYTKMEDLSPELYNYFVDFGKNVVYKNNDFGKSVESTSSKNNNFDEEISSRIEAVNQVMKIIQTDAVEINNFTADTRSLDAIVNDVYIKRGHLYNEEFIKTHYEELYSKVQGRAKDYSRTIKELYNEFVVQHKSNLVHPDDIKTIITSQLEAIIKLASVLSDLHDDVEQKKKRHENKTPNKNKDPGLAFTSPFASPMNSQTATFGTPQTPVTPVPFGIPATPQTPTFGTPIASPAFGSPVATGFASPFTTPTAISAFGTTPAPTFGTQQSTFGTTPAPAFGAQPSALGNPPAQPASSAFAFGSVPASSVFSFSSTPSASSTSATSSGRPTPVFGSSSPVATSTFGNSPAPSTPTFGTPSTPTSFTPSTPTSPTFGSPFAFGSQAAPSSPSTFGSPAAFGSSATPITASSSSSFNSPAPSSSSTHIRNPRVRSASSRR